MVRATDKARPAARRPLAKRKPLSAKPGHDGPPLIWGLHAVAFALANPSREIVTLQVTDNAERKLAEAIQKRGITPERVLPRALDHRLGAETVHQGALAEVADVPEPSLADLAEASIAQARPIVVLDQVTDPHNVGAVLRSAAVFGTAGLVMTRRHSPPLSGVLAKSASGALELVPVTLVQNLATALAELGTAGVRRIGLDATGEGLLEDAPLTGPVAIVLGAEGKGLRQSTLAACDVIARISGGGPIDSLNVSNAAAIALHLVAMRRREVRQ